MDDRAPRPTLKTGVRANAGMLKRPVRRHQGGLVAALFGCLAAAIGLGMFFWVHFYDCLPTRISWDGVTFFKRTATGPAIDRDWVYTNAPTSQGLRLMLTIRRARIDHAMLERDMATQLRRAFLYGRILQDGAAAVVFQHYKNPPWASYYIYREHGKYTWMVAFSELLDRHPSQIQADTAALLERRTEIFGKLDTLMTALLGRR